MLAALALSFGMSAAQGVLGGIQQRKQAQAQNALTKKQNRLNAMEAAHSIAGMRLQGAQARKQAASDMAVAGRMADSATGDAVASAAAAGVKGASIDAVAQDIDIELGRAKAEVQQSVINNTHNRNEQIRSLAVQTRLNLGTFQNVPSVGRVVAGAAVQGALTAGSQYASSFFKFGPTGGGADART